MDGHIIFCSRAGSKNKLSHLHGAVLVSPPNRTLCMLCLFLGKEHILCPQFNVHCSFLSKQQSIDANPELRKCRSFVLLQTCVSILLSNLETAD